MDQVKIGKFIATKRKENGMTQMQMAEKIGITDRAVSKWETGRSLPDAATMPELCDLLKITINDLLSGEVVSMERYNEEIEKNLLEMVKQKETSDKRLLKTEAVIMILSGIFLTAMVALGAVIAHQDKMWIFWLLFGIGIVQFIVSGLFAIRIEQVAGYYECTKCGFKYVPKYKNVGFSMHVGRTKYMKCPNCGKKSWQKKVINKD